MTTGAAPLTRIHLSNVASWAVPTSLVECVAWLQAQLDRVPEEYREKVEISIDTTISYDSPKTTIVISYWRPMIGEEVARQNAENRARLAQQLGEVERQADYLKRLLR